jgi:predicted DCC family thiol-disulfide oxidoreductase YuxK
MLSYFLIYDDNCPVCVKASRQVKRLDDLGLVNLVPLSVAAAPEGRSGLSKDKMANQMHLVGSDGRVWAGADAVARLATVMPRSRLVGRILMLPLVRQAARLVYGQIARHRLKLTRLLGST